MMDCDLHIHSSYSFDSLMDPRRILQVAKLRGLSAISITDHETMDVYANELSDPDRREIFEDYGIFVIKGMEIKTELGDVIGLFLQEEITSSDFETVVREIREQDGVVVLPHPFHRPADPADLVTDVDVLEILNGRSRDEQNDKAVALAEATQKPTLGGSDAHMYWEIGQIRTTFPGDIAGPSDPGDLKRRLLDAERNVGGSPLPYLATHGVSFASRRVKDIVGQVSR